MGVDGVIQIYAMVSLEDAVSVAELGANHVGMMVSEEGLPYSVNAELGRKICRAIRGRARCVMLPLTHESREIIDLALKVEADVVQIASYEEYLPYEIYAELFDELRRHGLSVIKVIPVGYGNELEASRRYSSLCDYLMLDTHGEPPSPLLRGFIGGTGRVHDWSISRLIAGESPKPVILAGGLNPSNVSEAIRTVRPQGVDAATSLDIPGSGGRKDLLKVKMFIEAARRAWSELYG
jgi:phosphoribosylanthranilate isomerase